jgi:tetratricopeptide (TPR) repeat protein
MMRYPVVLTALLAAIGVSAGFFMIPGQNEQIAMLASDGHEESALQLADGLVEKGNREPAILMQAFVLNQSVGIPERGLSAFRSYLEQRPDDPVAWQKAAAIFEESGQADLMREALENFVRLTRDPSAASRLSALYRLAGKEDDEFRVLQKVASKDLAPPEALRLAKLMLDRNQTDSAISILSRLDDTQPGLPQDAKIEMFVALMDSGEFEAAADRALKWRKGEDDTAFQDVLVGYLLRAGADQAALRLARQTESLADPKAFAHLFHLLSDHGRYDLIGQLLTQWVAFAQQVPAQQLDPYLQNVVNLAGAKGMSEELFHKLYRVFDNEGVAEFQASFMQAMFNRFGYAGVAPFRTGLRHSVLNARPVLAARLFTIEKNPLAARRYLLSARLPAISAGAQFEWLDLAQQILPPQELGYELARRAHAGAIPPELRKAVLDTMVRQGSQTQLVSVWRAFFNTSLPASMGTVTRPLISRPDDNKS